MTEPVRGDQALPHAQYRGNEGHDEPAPRADTEPALHAETAPTLPNALVEARNLVKQYGASRVVDNVSLTVRPGETLGLVGESGSGKSTVARLLLRLIPVTGGSIRFRGDDLLALSPRALRRARRHMQIVFQDPYGSLNPRMRVHDILAEPLRIHGNLPNRARTTPGDASAVAHSRRLSRHARRDALDRRLTEALAEVGLEPSALNRFPHEFSGGQRQRINIARALMLAPELVVLDEPISALDVSVGAQVVNLLRDLQRTRGLAYLFISHSMPLVRYLCDRVAVMQRGRIVETGPCLDVCEHPREPYTQRLIAATPRLPPWTR